MQNLFRKIISSGYWWVVLLIILAGINFLAAIYHSRYDLTKEKRFTLSGATKTLLNNIDNEITIEVFLKGDFPAGFRKLAMAVDEFLQECKEQGGGKIKIKFTDPLKDLSDSAANHLLDSMNYYYQIPAYTLQAPSKVGDEQKQKLVLPGAIISYKDTTIAVNLLKGNKSYGTDPEQLAELYNDVEATLEYRFASAIQKITSNRKPRIGYALGHGEAWGYNVDDAVRTLFTEYLFDTINIRHDPYIPTEMDAVVLIKPTIPFTNADKLKLDQYVMRGGKLFWMIDNMYADFDSLYQTGGFIAFDRSLNIEDILFNYGVRINQNLLQDMQCDKLPQVSGEEGSQQRRLVDWPFFPILNGTNHPISKNLDGVRAMFPNTLDTVKAAGIKKTFLLRSSSNARVLEAPAKVDFEFLQIAPDIKQFNVKDTAVAVLLEGKFKSLYANRISQNDKDLLAAYNVPFKNISETENKMIVVADGDIAMNQFSETSGPLPMGMNIFTRFTFANKEFFVNSLEYLVNPSGILETRAKDFTLRLLDPKKVKQEKTFWQLLNIALPVLLVMLVGYIFQWTRKRKYS